MSAPDRILISVLGSNFDAISRAIGETMLRTSRSPIFSEARDFATGIFDRTGRLIAQTAYIPILMGSLSFTVAAVRQHFGDEIYDGDIFILNDPYHGNTHLPDITVLMPVFCDGALVFWAVSKGHHADVGGSGVGGYNPEATTVWDEGIRIPPAKLYSQGERNAALWDTILTNVHLPFLVDGDLQCQVGSVRIGERRLKKLVAKFGASVVLAGVEALLDASERQTREAIDALPDGRYSAQRFIDHDGINRDHMIAVRVAVTVAGTDIGFDYSSSDPQADGYVNATPAATSSASYMALFMALGLDIRFNEGAMRAVSVEAPAGTIANATEPAPVTANTLAAGEPMIEAIWLALSEAIPERVGGAWARWCAPATAGINPRTGRPFGDIHFMCKGGGGAGRGFDGWDHLGTVVCSGGLRSPDPELHELVDPFTVMQYEFWPDSAGAGEWRGGMGTVYRWRVDAPEVMAANFGGGNRPATAPYGMAGGLAAPHHQLYLRRGSDVREIDAHTIFELKDTDVFEIFSSGGGGYGDPLARPVESVRGDVRDGLVSSDTAEKLYGVVVDPNTFEINGVKTAELRAASINE